MPVEKSAPSEFTDGASDLEITSNSIVPCNTKYSVSTEVILRFHALFAGLDIAYGTYRISGTQREDGKLEGSAQTVRGVVTDSLWKAHLEGAQGLGIIPIMADNNVSWGCIDIDVYDGLDSGRMASRIEHLKLPLVPCRSKSGGMHLFCFTQAPVPAAKMQSKLKEIAALIGQGQAEIFPKQTKILAEQGDLGSWVNMPYFSGDDTTRFSVRPNGDARNMVEFLDAAEAAKVSPDWTSRRLPASTDALADGPPCLQHLIGEGFPEGTRNRGLFNLTVYARKSEADRWKDRVQELNQRYMVPPLAHDETSQIIKSVDRKEYGYTCADAVLAAHCDRLACRGRKFGVGRAGSNALPVLSSLTKLTTTPPIWFLEVEGHRLELTTEELLNPIAFQIKCADHDVIVPLVKRASWCEHLRPAMESVHRVPVSDDDSEGDDSSAKGHFLELLEYFCTGRAQARILDEIVLGKPYTGDDGRTQFRLSGLMDFLNRKNFKELKRNTIVSIMKDQGGTNRQQIMPNGQNLRLWSLPAFRVRDTPMTLPDEVTDPGTY